MKKLTYKMVEGKALKEMHACFSNEEEFSEFITELDIISREIQFLSMFRDRVDNSEALLVYMKQICVITIFYKNNMELIREFINKLEHRDIDEDEMREILEKK